MKFKVLIGRHAENGQVYGPGSVVETHLDLGAKFNTAGFSPKFEQLPDSAPANTVAPSFESPKKEDAAVTQTSVETLRSMSVDELRKFAEAEEIELGNARSKEDLIKKINSSM